MIYNNIWTKKSYREAKPNDDQRVKSLGKQEKI